MNKKAHHIYYNMFMTNTTTTKQLASLTDSRTTPIVEHMEDYELAVIKFTIPTSQIPIMFSFPTGADATSQSKGYSVTVVNGATVSQQFLTYVPIDNTGQTYIYSYKTLTDMINVALKDAWTIADAGDPNYPFMVFNSDSQLFSIYYSTASSVANVKIFFNTNLSFLFPSFSYVFYNSVDFSFANFGEYAQLQNDNPFLPNETLVTNYYQTIQEFPSTISLYQPRSIRLVCGQVPTRQETIPSAAKLIPLGININSIPPTMNIVSNNNSQNILTDFDLPLANSIADIKPFLQFSQFGPYRYIDIKSQGPLNIFDCTIYLVDAVGNLYPLYFDPNQSITIKFMFERKYM
jgi:hypothetical protein